MKNVMTLMTGLFLLSTAYAVEFREIKGELITTYAATNEPSSEERVGYHTLAILEDHGSIQEVAVPASESMRWLKRFSGMPVAVEIASDENSQIPMVSNMAIFFKDTQVTYWKPAVENYFDFPQEKANEALKTQTIAGIVQFDNDTVSKYASGFTITARDKVYKIAKAPRQMLYTLRAMTGQLATFVVKTNEKKATASPPISIQPYDLPGFRHNLNHTMTTGLGGRLHMLGGGIFGSHRDPYGLHVNVPFGASVMDAPASTVNAAAAGNAANSSSTSAPVTTMPVVEPDSPAEEEEKPEEGLVEIHALIKPMQTGSVTGVASMVWKSGTQWLNISLKDESEIDIYLNKNFSEVFSDESLGSSTLQIRYRLVYIESGLVPMVESHQVLKESEYADSEEWPGP